jgi:hypothetical protein
MDGRKNNKGTIGNNGGRKPKATEQALAEKLHPLSEKALQALENGLEAGQPWAVKLYFEYLYGKPRQIEPDPDQAKEDNQIKVTFYETKLYANGESETKEVTKA